MVRESPPYDFLITFDATSCKMIRRIRWSKVNGKSDSTDNFTRSSIENNLKIIRGRVPHHDTIRVIFNFVNLFLKKLP